MRIPLPVHEPARVHGNSPIVDRSQPYPSCRWIEEGLAFNRRGLHACLIVHHGRGFPKLCDFEGGEVPMDQVLAARARIIRENQAGGHEACRGCPNLVRRRWPTSRFAVRLVGIAQFARCNIYCNYCFLQTQPPESYAEGLAPYAIAPAIDGLIRKRHLAADATFDWGGGEPTIYPEFDALLERLTRRGGRTFVHTNGTRFPRPLARGLPAGRIHIVCSVDAGFASTYVQLKGRDLLERVWRTLSRYRAAGCDVQLKYIVTHENHSEGELTAFCERARKIGARRLIVDLDYNHPSPTPAVLQGLQRLHELGSAYGMHTTFGATGAQFTPELDVAGRLRMAAASRDGMVRRAVARGRRYLAWGAHFLDSARRRRAFPS
jgi:pyruvate-formate lyase-activating enzyme